ncbi:hypothetical protein HPB50_015417 [Hyalomma asiaticum]|uniref:Uncharacterized protein n=1 Tax=Hyalomma asiaticum TaxID=266040 RepID=A0ACB7SI57_HYAAI|nr:hypothetical protein HPB50_015417 [Hyalomma asiaticum]
MVQALNASVPAGEGPFNVKQVRQKLENLNKQYRKLRRCGTTTGAKGIEWPFYWQLHAFLGSLPVNDSDLVEESLEVPVVDHAPDQCEIVATNDTAVATNDSEESESATMEAAVSGTSSAETPSVEPESSPRSSNKKGKKRPASVVLHDLLELHQKGEERAAKAASDSLERKKELVALQKESNAIQQRSVKYPVLSEVPALRTTSQVQADMQLALSIRMSSHGVKGFTPLLQLPKFDLEWGVCPD